MGSIYELLRLFNIRVAPPLTHGDAADQAASQSTHLGGSRIAAEILDFLLSVDFPGRAALQEKLPGARVYQRCSCGCATIEVTVEEPAGLGRYGPEVEARSRSNQPARDLILFVGERGVSIELVCYEEDPAQSEFPAPETFEAPRRSS